jgi:predicted nucleic acid-binding protein
VSKPVRLRLFLDSNVLLGGIVAEWGLDKAVLSLCAAKIVQLVLAEAVRDEIEENLLLHAQRLPAPQADKLLQNYRRLIDLTNPEIVSYPDSAAVRNARNMIRHQADVPVLLSAIAAQPDWLLSHNAKHFTPAVAHKTGLRIATPLQFFRTLSTLLQ